MTPQENRSPLGALLLRAASALALAAVALASGPALAAPTAQPFVGVDLMLRRPFLVPIGSDLGAVALRPTLAAGGLFSARTSAYRFNLGLDGRVYDYIGVSGSPLRAGGRANLGLAVGSGASLKPVLRAHVEYGLEDRIEQAPVTLPHLDAGTTLGVQRDEGALVGALLFDLDGESWKGSYSGVIVGGRGELGYRYFPLTDLPAVRVAAHRNLALGATTFSAETGLSGRVGRRTQVDAWLGWGRLSEGGAKVAQTAPVFGELAVAWEPRPSTSLVAYGQRRLNTRTYAAGDITNAAGLTGGLDGLAMQAKLGGAVVLHQYLGSGLARTDTTLRASGELAWAPAQGRHLWVVGSSYVMARSSSDDSVSGLGWGVGLGAELWPSGGRERGALRD